MKISGSLRTKRRTSLKVKLVTLFVVLTMAANCIIAFWGFILTRIYIRYVHESGRRLDLADIHFLVLRLVILSAIVLLITGILLYVRIYQDIIAPVKTLSSATQQIANGELDFDIEVKDDLGEITDLFMDFENMRRRLKDSSEEKISNEEANRQLISNITHDLKTPITTIKGYAEGILDGIASTPEKQEKYIRTIYNKASELDRLLNELTYYTHMDQSRIPYNFSKINLYNYFQDCVEELSIDLESRDFYLSFKSEIDPDTIIIADPEQLKKVIANIIGNSVKYCDKSKGRIYIQLKDADSFVLIDIVDNGKGIAPKDLPMIFDRFYRTDASRSSTTGGSGIGLSIVKKIVEDHGGRIWATSTLGEGTTMHIELRKYIDQEDAE